MICKIPFLNCPSNWFLCKSESLVSKLASSNLIIGNKLNSPQSYLGKPMCKVAFFPASIFFIPVKLISIIRRFNRTIPVILFPQENLHTCVSSFPLQEILSMSLTFPSIRPQLSCFESLQFGGFAALYFSPKNILWRKLETERRRNWDQQWRENWSDGNCWENYERNIIEIQLDTFFVPLGAKYPLPLKEAHFAKKISCVI